MPRPADPAYAANQQVVTLPWQSTVGAAGITALLAVVGKSQPGTFLKAAAYLSAFNVSVTACQLYGEREINRAVFKLDKVEPKPGKLWERTKHWTVDDMVVGGGLLGSFLALNPRALPGVSGWKCLIGAATVGCAVGGYVGESRLLRAPPQLISMVIVAKAQNRAVQYARVKEDVEAQRSLSRFGKIALGYYTWPFSLNLFGNGSASGPGGADGPFMKQGHGGVSQQEMDKSTLIQIEFSNGELNGPDFERGYRAYKDSLADRDESALQEWLEHLQKLRHITATEAQYIWQHLANKETKFYGMAEEDREKDIARRELQLLNNMGCDFAMRDTIFSNHIADATKQLEQMGRKDAVGQKSLVTAKALKDELPAHWKDHYSPHLVTEHVRTNWARQKEVLGIFEEAISMHEDIQPKAGSAQETHFNQVKENAEAMKKNVEATERLLRELEEQVRRADEHSEKSKPI